MDIRKFNKYELLNMYKAYLKKKKNTLFIDLMNNECTDKVKSIDTDLFKNLAKHYMTKKSLPTSFIVYRAYKRFIYELKTQFDFIYEKFDIELNESDIDPYKNYEEMRQDIKENNRLIVFNGGKGVEPMENNRHKGRDMNVIFRLIHDLLGHYIDENNFFRVGEENAYQTHKAFFSVDSWAVLAQETRAQQAAYYYGVPFKTFKEQYFNIIPEKFQ